MLIKGFIKVWLLIEEDEEQNHYDDVDYEGCGVYDTLEEAQAVVTGMQEGKANEKKKVFLLPSIDGQAYLTAVIVPPGMDFENADYAVKKAIETATKDNPAEWTWDEDLAPELIKNGLEIAQIGRCSEFWDQY